MMKHRNQIICMTGIVFGIFLSMGYVNPYGGEIKLSELILQLSGSRGEFALGFSITELLELSMRMLPSVVVEAYLGIALYRHFCTASIYIFSRCPNRGEWYWREMLEIGESIVFFQITLLFMVIVTTMFRYEVQFDGGGIGLAFYHILIQSLWMYSITFFINLLALWMGSNLSFVVVLAVQSVEIAMLSILGTMSSYFETNIWAVKLAVKLNPVSHMVFGWHSSYIQSINQVLHQRLNQMLILVSETFYLEISLAVLVCINVCMLLAGFMVVRKHDLLISDAETGVA